MQETDRVTSPARTVLDIAPAVTNDQLVKLVNEARIARHVRLNHDIAGFEVDGYFPIERLIVQVDGWDIHCTRKAFEEDRLKDAIILERTQIPTVRITKRRLTDLATAEAARLRKILDTRRQLFGQAA